MKYSGLLPTPHRNVSHSASTFFCQVFPVEHSTLLLLFHLAPPPPDKPFLLFFTFCLSPLRPPPYLDPPSWSMSGLCCVLDFFVLSPLPYISTPSAPRFYNSPTLRASTVGFIIAPSPLRTRLSDPLVCFFFSPPTLALSF